MLKDPIRRRNFRARGVLKVNDSGPNLESTFSHLLFQKVIIVVLLIAIISSLLLKPHK